MSRLLPIAGPWRKTLRLGPELTETLIWPAKKAPKTVFFMIPGNPGIINFYNEFLSELHSQDPDNLEIIGVSHLGHSLFENETGHLIHPKRTYLVRDQVDHIKRVFLYFYELYSDNKLFPTIPKFVLCGHSVGAYVIEQVFRDCSPLINKVFYLFPTVTHIRKTPNGNKLWFLFNSFSIFLVSWFAALLRFSVPSSLVAKVVKSPTVLNVLTMSVDEMDIILDLDTEFYADNGSKFIMYYGTTDGWVPLEYYHLMKKSNPKMQVHLCEKAISHSFIADGSFEIARFVGSWLNKMN
ncbi:hypothetical protein BB560_001498 [Smittium megazygosporum]|uniref:Lipid droplet-associated hydrolase n=1 Tax=Smittium megazygosporum TaxID=133381 RepID=A0A2T9ZHF9_9FUNG|nr:hypothetical protein BB560_001498 [Smittium megazygosporum]